MREVTTPLPAGNLIDSPRLVLRDGTVASVRASTPSDRDEVRRFFHDLSAGSRRNRFFTASEPSDASRRPDVGLQRSRLSPHAQRGTGCSRTEIRPRAAGAR